MRYLFLHKNLFENTLKINTFVIERTKQLLTIKLHKDGNQITGKKRRNR